MIVKDYFDTIAQFAPFNACMEDDNVGLLLGEMNTPVNKVLVTLDADMPAMEKAVTEGCNLIVSHHPFIFSGECSITDQTAQGRKILYAFRNHLSIISAHTNLDGCVGGIADTLADKLNLQVVDSFLPMQQGAYLCRLCTTTCDDINAFLSHAAKTLSVRPRFVLPHPERFCKIAICTGSGTFAMQDAINAGADTFVTGDVKYSAFMRAREAGLNLIDLGHFETEQIIVPVLAERLSALGAPVIAYIIPSPIEEIL